LADLVECRPSSFSRAVTKSCPSRRYVKAPALWVALLVGYPVCGMSAGGLQSRLRDGLGRKGGKNNRKSRKDAKQQCMIASPFP
jgi:hypothetical protein